MTTISDDMESMKNSAIIIKENLGNIKSDKAKLIEWFEDSTFNEQTAIVQILTELLYANYDVIHNRLHDSFTGGHFDAMSDSQLEELAKSDKIRDLISEIDDQISTLRYETRGVQ